MVRFACTTNLTFQDLEEDRQELPDFKNQKRKAKIRWKKRESLTSRVEDMKLRGVRKRKRGENVDGTCILGENLVEMEREVGHLTKKLRQLKLDTTLNDIQA